MKHNLGLALVQSEPEVALPTFDLSYVERQMLSDGSYPDWTLSRFQQAADEYRKFLALCKAFPQKSLGISRDADQVWHRHILNTRRYMADCSAYFGCYFHHNPESGEDENAEAQRETNRLHFEVFGIHRTLHVQATCVGGGCMNNG